MESSKVYRALQTILCAGLICGTLDGLSATVVTWYSGGTTIRLFQGIASGWLGRSAYQGGAGSALLGVAFHFLVALGAATTYYAASRWLPLLLDRALVCGVAFGGAAHVFMALVVIPLSAIGRRPFEPRSFAVFLAVSMVVVGPSISLTLRHFSRAGTERR